MNYNFTAKARAAWNSIPSEAQEELLSSVWCVSCHEMTTITNFTGRVGRGDLVLKGACSTCGGDVASLIEGG